MPGKKYWADLTTTDFDKLDLDRVIAVLPVGAIEQHGPHLPVSVDSDVVSELVRRTALVVDDLPVLFLPTMPIGKSNEHIAFKGTLTLSAETLISLWMDIGASVARSGVKKLLLLNGHGGNVGVMDIVARDLRARHGMLTASCSWYSLYCSDDLLDKHELTHGIHAGDGETSVMLSIRSDFVDRAAIKRFASAGEQWHEDFEHICVGGRAAKIGWLIQDLNPEGACGDATQATAEKGEMLLTRGVEGLVKLLRELDGLSAANLQAYR